MTAADEIRPPQRDLPRYRSERPLPPYRFVPGRHPHPTRDRDGHSYSHRAPELVAWSPGDWRTLAPWLDGIDLFNRFYFWEAHEEWETLWRASPQASAPRLLLQGLIQIAAAMLKIHLQSVAGATRLSHEGIDKLQRVSVQTPTLMGLDVRETTLQMNDYFSPLARQVLPSLDDGAPILRLAAERSLGEQRS